MNTFEEVRSGLSDLKVPPYPYPAMSERGLRREGSAHWRNGAREEADAAKEPESQQPNYRRTDINRSVTFLTCQPDKVHD